MKKRVLMFCLFMSFLSSMFAGGLYQGSAGTLGDDTSGFFDLLDWDSLEFENQIFYTSLDYSTPINVSYAKKNESNQLQLGYAGNLWSDVASNAFQLLYGFDNKALKLSFNQEKIQLDSQYQVDACLFSAGYGINFTEQFGLLISAGIGPGSYDATGTSVSFTISSFSAMLKGMLTSTDSSISYFSVGYSGNYISSQYNKIQTSYSINELFGSYNLAYYITDNFSYGLNVSLPINILSYSSGDSNSASTISTTEIECLVANGFVLDLVPEIFQVSAGILTTFPSITSSGSDSQSVKGTMYNSVYVGTAVNIIDGVHIDFNTNLNIFDGISIDELWKSTWTLSVTASF